MDDAEGPRQRIGVVLFDRFELLDVCGPLEMYGVASRFEFSLIGPSAGPVRSTQGPSLQANSSYDDAAVPDIVFVPGGIGSRILVEDRPFLDWLARWASGAPLVTSVCTGSALLAAAGLLDRYRATSNKRAWAWAVSQGPAVEWVPTARWVEDRDRWTSSGVAAGMDMALAIIAALHGRSAAEEVVGIVEYEWHRDAGWDPFAAANGLG